MARIICPFCLKHHDFSTKLECEERGETVPAIYVKDYNKVPPMWLVTIGFSRHGKTTYLAALTLMLENISSIWEDVYYRQLDQATMDAIRQMRREAMQGILPESNPKGIPRPLLFNVYNIPDAGSRCLVMYDVAGQIYNSLSEVQEYVTAIKHVNTTWFLVSLPDLEDDKEGKNITDLFQVYLSGMENLRIDLKGRNLIVVYTKADQIEFTASIDNYLRNDPFKGLTRRKDDLPDMEAFSLSNYIQSMQDVSTELERYTRRYVNGGAAFINMVKASGMNLVFCTTSALGTGPDKDSNLLREDALRYRVLDPFLWAITLEKPVSSKFIGLIIDASSDDQQMYNSALISEVWEQLSKYGEVTTYYLGQTTPTSHPGQRPPESPPRITRQRLIGTILENASPDARFMVIANDYIIDLEDFDDTSWQDSLLFVTTVEDSQQNWSNKIIYRSGDQAHFLVEMMLNLLEKEK